MLQKITILCLISFSFSSALSAWENDSKMIDREWEAKTKKPRTGPQGPPGPPGPPGNVVDNYISCYGDIQAAGDNTPLYFNHDQAPPKGIVHPFEGNEARFQVSGGVYYISWTLTATNAVNDYLSLTIFNVSTHQPFPKIPEYAANLAANTTQILSGQTIVELPANSLFEMRVTSQERNAHVKPTLTIIRIAG